MTTSPPTPPLTDSQEHVMRQTPPQDPMSAAAAALDLLNDWHAQNWPDVAKTAGHAAQLLWDGWRGSGGLEYLPQHDQAAVHHALALGWRIHCEPRSRRGGDFWRSRVDEFRIEAAYSVALRDGRHAGSLLLIARARHATEAVQLRHRLSALPSAWQSEVMERLTPERTFSWQDELAPARPTLHECLEHAEAAFSKGTLPPEPDRWVAARARGTDMVQRLSRLAVGWQTETVRRIADGVAPLTAIANAAQSINIVRTAGVYLAPTASPRAPAVGPDRNAPKAAFARLSSVREPLQGGTT